jgi:hypothetical protein
LIAQTVGCTTAAELDGVVTPPNTDRDRIFQWLSWSDPVEPADHAAVTELTAGRRVGEGLPSSHPSVVLQQRSNHQPWPAVISRTRARVHPVQRISRTFESSHLLALQFAPAAVES